MKFTYAIVITILISLSSCSPKLQTTNFDNTDEIQTTNNANKRLIHNVYFWYKADADPAEILDFENELKKLGKIKSIQNYYLGKPAKTAVRGPVDHTYNIAINVIFKTIEDHDAYQVDPIHLAFIEKCKHLWEKVVVYDNEIK